MTGQIVLAATPIGNVGDASDRLKEALTQADTVAAEDTRKVRDLARRLGVTITGRVESYHDHNEAARAGDLVARARAGETVLVVSDAGSPLVSDPGFRIVEAAWAADVPVTTLPGPSAALAALAVSGFSCDRFCFEGFPPRTSAARERLFRSLAHERRTMVFFESPRRLAATLADMRAAFGEGRLAVVARELTKTHEEVRRDGLGVLLEWARSREILGEIVVVVAGATAERQGLEELADEAEARVGAGERLKDVVADIANSTGVSGRELYGEVLARRAAPPATSPR